MKSKFQEEAPIGRILMGMGVAIIFFSSVLFSFEVLDKELMIPAILSGILLEVAGVFFMMMDSIE